MIIEVKTNPCYPVVIESGILDRAGQRILGHLGEGASILLVSDSNVFPLYGGRLEASIKASGLYVRRFVFDAGEPAKTLSTVIQIYNKMAECGFTRTDAVVNLGGGVAGDMGGFAAATFLRGMAYFQIPTSLLAQVDASIGGKTGVDLPFGKNLVGAFHQPTEVLMDPDTLKTLPKAHIHDGLGEVIKYGCIADLALLEQLENGIKPADMNGILANCVQCKADVVAEDTLDTGRRMILNFGHTFGHALEKLWGFSGLLHGEAVGIGMVLAAAVGTRLGITPAGTRQRIAELLQKYDLPAETEFTADEIMAATALDKKNDGSIIRLILLKSLGEAVIYPITRPALHAALRAVKG